MKKLEMENIEKNQPPHPCSEEPRVEHVFKESLSFFAASRFVKRSLSGLLELLGSSDRDVLDH